MAKLFLARHGKQHKGGGSDPTQPDVGFELMCTDPNGDVITVLDGQGYMCVSDDMDGMTMIDADAALVTASSSGAPTIQLYNVTQNTDMLSTRITIDANEHTSYTAATPPVINTANDDVATGDILRVDVDVAGTGAKGLIVMLTFR